MRNMQSEDDLRTPPPRRPRDTTDQPRRLYVPVTATGKKRRRTSASQADAHQKVLTEFWAAVALNKSHAEAKRSAAYAIGYSLRRIRDIVAADLAAREGQACSNATPPSRQCKPGSGRPSKKMTPSKVSALEAFSESHNGAVTYRDLHEQVKDEVSLPTVWGYVKRSFDVRRKRYCPVLTEVQKQKRVEFAEVVRKQRPPTRRSRVVYVAIIVIETAGRLDFECNVWSPS